MLTPPSRRRLLPDGIDTRGCTPLTLEWMHARGLCASTSPAKCPASLAACTALTSRDAAGRAPPSTPPAADVHDITRSGGLGAGNCFMMGPFGTDESKREAACTAFAHLLSELRLHSAAPNLERIARAHKVHLHGPTQREPAAYVARLCAALRKLTATLKAGKRLHLRCSGTCKTGAQCHGDLLLDDATRRATGLPATALPLTAAASAGPRPASERTSGATATPSGGAAPKLLWLAGTLAQAASAAPTAPSSASLCTLAPTITTPTSQTATVLVPLLICVAALDPTACYAPTLGVLCPAGSSTLFGAFDTAQLGSGAHEPAITRARQWGGLGTTDNDPHVFLAGEIDLLAASADGSTPRTAMRICVLPLFLDHSRADSGKSRVTLHDLSRSTQPNHATTQPNPQGRGGTSTTLLPNRPPRGARY